MEGFHYVSLLPIIALERGDECRVIMSSFLHIILYYYMLLHIVAFANTLLDLVLTGPRASTPDILDTSDDDVLEPYPQSPVVQLTGGAVLPRWTAAHGGTCWL